jgi:glutamine synthetase
MAVFCDIIDPGTGEGYARDPRMIAKRTEAYLKSTKLGDTIFVGPEAEFFIFDDVKFSTSPYNTGFKLDGIELPTNSDRDYEQGNMGHRMRTKGGYFPMNPMDSAQDMRGEMLSVMGEMGLSVEKHHHEVASSQHELGTKYQPLTIDADLQICDPQRSPCLWQDRDLHAKACDGRQWFGHALPLLDLERWQAANGWQSIC